MTKSNHSDAGKEQEPQQPPRRSGAPPGGALFFLILAICLIAGAFLVPGEWIVKVSQLYNTPESKTDAFDDRVRDVDEALARGALVPVTALEFRGLHAHVASRRFATVGKVTGEEVREAARIFDEFRPRVANESNEGSRDAVRSVRNAAIDAALPRLSRQTIDAELETLHEQVLAARFAEASSKGPAQPSPAQPSPGANAADGDCQSCHLELVELPDGRSIDLAHLWPTIEAERLGNGRSIPNRMSAAEADGCTSCHAPHDSDDFGVSVADRAANMGMWVHVRQVESVVQVQVKVQNIGAPHRVPAGDLGRAYAVAVRAKGADEELAPWWGNRLPTALHERAELGLFLGRTAVDAAGKPVADPSRAVDLIDDSRLELGRFYDEYFLFEAPESGTVDVSVDLLYLRDWPAGPAGEETVIQKARRSLTMP